MRTRSGDSYHSHDGRDPISNGPNQKTITSRSIYLTISERDDIGIDWSASRCFPPHLNYGIFIGPSGWHVRPQNVDLALECSFYEVVWKYYTYSLEEVWHFNDFRVCPTWKKSLLGMIKLAEVPKRHNKRKTNMSVIRSIMESLERPSYDTPEEDSWCWVKKAISALQGNFKDMPRDIDWEILHTQSRNLASRAISKEMIRQQGAMPLGVFDNAMRREYEIRYKVMKSLQPTKVLVEILEPSTKLCLEKTETVLDEKRLGDEDDWDEKRRILKKGRSWKFGKTEYS